MKFKNAGKINYVTVNRLMCIYGQTNLAILATGIVNLYVRSDTIRKNVSVL